MTRIAKVQTADRLLNEVQQNIARVVEPIASNPIVIGLTLYSVVLQSGANTVYHKLDRNLQGWFPVRWHGGWAQIYDTQDANTTPALTLLLNASAGVTVDLYVY